MLYFLIFIFILLLSYIYDIRQFKKNKLFFFRLLLIILILFAGLRYRVGSDTISYIGQFRYFPTIDNIFNIGLDNFLQRPLWVIYFSFFKTIGSFYILQLSNAIIVNISYFAFARKYTKNWFTFILLYYIFWYIGLNFEIMRESLAISIAIWGFRYLEQKKWIKYFLISFISFNFHESAIILFIIPFFLNFNLNFKKWTIFLFLFSFTLLSLKSDIDLNRLFIILLGNSTIFHSKFEIYNSMNNVYNINYYLNYWYLPLFCIPSLIFYSNLKLKIYVRNLNLIYLSSILSILMVFMSVLGRFSNYLNVFILLFLSDFIIEFVSKEKIKLKFLYLMFLIAIITPGVLINYQSRYGDIHFYNKYYPYSSIFNEFKDSSREEMANEYSEY